MKEDGRRASATSIRSDPTKDNTVKLLIIFGLTLLITGTLSLEAIEWVGSVPAKACATCKPSLFASNNLLQLVQCTGEAICLPIYYIERYITTRVTKRKVGYLEMEYLGDQSLPRARWYHWMGPGLCDACGSALIFYGIVFLDTHTVTVIRCSTLLVTALMCIVWFKRDMRIASWLGLLIITIGQIMQSLDDTLKGKRPSNRPLLGSILTFLGVLSSALLYVVQENLWCTRSFSPVEATGWIGMIGIILSLVIEVIAHYSGSESMTEAYYQAFHTPQLLGALMSFMIIVAFVNSSALAVISLGSALFAVTVVTARNVTVWLMDLALMHQTFDWFSFGSQLIVTIGFLFYAHVLVMLFPQRVRKYLDADVHVSCRVIRYKTDVSEDTESTDETADSRVHLKAERSDETTSTSPTYVNVTRDPRVFFEVEKDDKDTHWIYIERDIEIHKLPKE